MKIAAVTVLTVAMIFSSAPAAHADMKQPVEHTRQGLAFADAGRRCDGRQPCVPELQVAFGKHRRKVWAIGKLSREVFVGVISSLIVSGISAIYAFVTGHGKNIVAYAHSVWGWPAAAVVIVWIVAAALLGVCVGFVWLFGESIQTDHKKGTRDWEDILTLVFYAAVSCGLIWFLISMTRSALTYQAS